MTALKSALPGLERNAVVAASAGTGKTHLITNIYLSHVLGLRSDRRQVPAEAGEVGFRAAEGRRVTLHEMSHVHGGERPPATGEMAMANRCGGRVE